MAGRPGSQAVARDQHANGEAHAWESCDTCKAGRGEQCYNLTTRRSAMLGTVVVRTETHKRTPCRGRTWVPRDDRGRMT